MLWFAADDGEHGRESHGSEVNEEQAEETAEKELKQISAEAEEQLNQIATEVQEASVEAASAVNTENADAILEELEASLGDDN